jgi:hypothetical protein
MRNRTYALSSSELKGFHVSFEVLAQRYKGLGPGTDRAYGLKLGSTRNIPYDQPFVGTQLYLFYSRLGARTQIG